MKKPSLLKVVIVAALAAAALVFALSIAFQRERIATLERRVADLKSDTVPVRFMILSRSDEEVSARVRLYDMDGAEIAKIEKAWSGRELYLDFLVLPAEGRYLAFPWRIFTDKTPPNAGTMLPGYYDRDGFPQVFNSSRLDSGMREALVALFRKSQHGESVRGGFGSAVHDVRQVAGFEVGVVYKVITRISGGIEIVVD